MADVSLWSISEYNLINAMNFLSQNKYYNYVFLFVKVVSI